MQPSTLRNRKPNPEKIISFFSPNAFSNHGFYKGFLMGDAENTFIRKTTYLAYL
jgi:hypothetical protein